LNSTILKKNIDLNADYSYHQTRTVDDSVQSPVLLADIFTIHRLLQERLHMLLHTSSTPGQTNDLDWEKARTFLRQRLIGKLNWVERDGDLEDLVQESLVQLLRSVRRQGLREPKALMTTIANNVFTDYVRAKQARGRLAQNFRVEVATVAWQDMAVEKLAGDPAVHIRFVIQSIFHSRSPGCCSLATAFFQQRNWKMISEQIGESHEAIRARWSRCLAVLRKIAVRNPELALLREWALD